MSFTTEQRGALNTLAFRKYLSMLRCIATLYLSA